MGISLSAYAKLWAYVWETPLLKSQSEKCTSTIKGRTCWWSSNLLTVFTYHHDSKHKTTCVKTVTNHARPHNPFKIHVQLSHTDSPCIKSTVNWFAFGKKKNPVIPVKNNTNVLLGCKLNASIPNQTQRTLRWAWKRRNAKLWRHSLHLKMHQTKICPARRTKSNPTSPQMCVSCRFRLQWNSG